MIDDQMVALSLMMPESILQSEVRRLFLNPSVGEEQFITLMIESMIKNMLQKSVLFGAYMEYKDFARRNNAQKKS